MKPIHGDRRPLHPLYTAWRNMNQRCTNPNRPQFKDWGGRGITVCEEWKHDYLAFKEWALTHGYRKGLTIERIDNDGSYSPDNCCWVTHKQNCRNTRARKDVEAFGEKKSVGEWTEDIRCSVAYYTLLYRLRRGWSPEEAIQRGVP